MRERESTRVEIVRPSSGKLGCTFRLLAGREGGGIKSSDWTFHFLYKSATNLVNVSRVIESSKIGRGRESDFPPGANKLTRRRWLMRMLCNTEKEGFLRRINSLQMPLNPRINTSVWAPLSLPSHPCFPFQSLVSVKPNKHFPFPRILFIGSALNCHLAASQAPTNYLLNNSRKLQKKDCLKFPSNVLEVPQPNSLLMIRYALK